MRQRIGPHLACHSLRDWFFFPIPILVSLSICGIPDTDINWDKPNNCLVWFCIYAVKYTIKQTPSACDERGPFMPLPFCDARCWKCLMEAGGERPEKTVGRQDCEGWKGQQSGNGKVGEVDDRAGSISRFGDFKGFSKILTLILGEAFQLLHKFLFEVPWFNQDFENHSQRKFPWPLADLRISDVYTHTNTKRGCNWFGM